MLLAENRPFNIALVNPDAVFQVDATVGLKPAGHGVIGDEPQSPKTTGPVVSDMLESMCTWISDRSDVNPEATTVM